MNLEITVTKDGFGNSILSCYSDGYRQIPVGFVYYTGEPFRDAQINYFEVVKEFRGMGVGRKMIEYLKGLKRSIVVMRKCDEEMKRFYLHNGFYETGQVMSWHEDKEIGRLCADTKKENKENEVRPERDDRRSG